MNRFGFREIDVEGKARSSLSVTGVGTNLVSCARNKCDRIVYRQDQLEISSFNKVQQIERRQIWTGLFFG